MIKEEKYLTLFTDIEEVENEKDNYCNLLNALKIFQDKEEINYDIIDLLKINRENKIKLENKIKKINSIQFINMGLLALFSVLNLMESSTLIAIPYFYFAIANLFIFLQKNKTKKHINEQADKVETYIKFSNILSEEYENIKIKDLPFIILGKIRKCDLKIIDLEKRKKVWIEQMSDYNEKIAQMLLEENEINAKVTIENLEELKVKRIILDGNRKN